MLSELVRQLDSCLLPDLAYQWDNVGWMIGRGDQEIRKILLTLEINQAVIEEAKACAADLIVSHHPLIFRGLKKITTEDKGSQIFDLIKSDIAVYSCHTNYDIIKGGLNDYVAGLLNLKNVSCLTEEDSEHRGIGRYGDLERAMTMQEFVSYVGDVLKTKGIRAVYGNERPICRVGLVTGSGAEFLPLAIEKGCDAFVTGDMKYHEAQDAMSAAWNVVDAGHYDTEIVFNQSIQEFLEKHLTQKFTYIQSKALKGPFRTL